MQMNATIRPHENDGARRSANRDWLRALQRTASIERDRCHTLPRVFDEIVAAHGQAPALSDERESLTFDELSRRANRYARWAVESDLQKGEVVALAMGNCVDYVAIWLGLTRVGVIAALLNTNLGAPALAHCLRAAGARRVIASGALFDVCRDASALLEAPVEIFTHLGESDFASGVEAVPGAPSCGDYERDVALSDPALFIFTSGTTGLPKAAIVTHRRILYWALWFSGLVDMRPQDRMYNCLPMYHSVGGVVAVWAPLLSGASVALRARFSASNFWRDVAAERCTMFQYIGELCRYLLNAPQHAAEQRHGLRLIVGNGLRPDVWTPFQQRFAIPRVLEFYAATESNFSLYNVEGEPGAIGRVPAFLTQNFQIAVVAVDAASGQPARLADGRCIRCGVDEVGEAIGRIETAEGARGVFEGYTNRADSEKKILRDVFEPGDAWMRSGDLMRKDSRGFYYFADRIGDSFRWKGENVSTLEVAQALAACPGVCDASVCGVSVPAHEGRAGMAALTVREDFDLGALRRHVDAALPAYARPLFIRICATLDVTETFKHKKHALADEGFDPARVADALYFAQPGEKEYVSLDAALFRRICANEFRL
jgi:fatty-acyl-CoA synthase